MVLSIFVFFFIYLLIVLFAVVFVRRTMVNNFSRRLDRQNVGSPVRKVRLLSEIFHPPSLKGG